MKLGDYKLIFVAVGLIGILLIASPILGDLIRLPAGEQFSELYLLGPERLAQNYPSNIVVDQNYSVYVGVGNHLGSSAYYILYVKLLNQTDLLPNTTTATPSPVAPLFESRFAIQDGQSLESPMNFTVANAAISQNQATINTLTINNVVFEVNKLAAWNTNSTKYNYQLLFELWLYNKQTASIEFNSRYVDLQLNLTRTP